MHNPTIVRRFEKNTTQAFQKQILKIDFYVDIL